MRTASTKLDKEEYAQLRDYAESQGTSVSELLREFVQGLGGGGAEPRPTKNFSTGVRGKIPYCPRCGFLLSFNFASSEWGCLNCGFFCYAEAPTWQEGEPIKL